ncbi:hypothetical protein C8039_07250 [Halogeometricum sp. wsp3]|nr:hypothetical protein C8039_07250 [Halogeometricum sp. wsp3]
MVSCWHDRVAARVDYRSTRQSHHRPRCGHRAPPAVSFAGAWVVRYAGRLRRLTGRQAKLNETGIALIHVGAALLIVSVSFVYVFSTTASVGIVGATELDDTGERIVRDVEGSPYTVEVTNYSPENTPTMTEAAMTPAEVRLR